MPVQTLFLPPLLALLLTIHLGFAFCRALLPPELRPFRALLTPLAGCAITIMIVAALTTTTALTPPQIVLGLAIIALPLNAWAWWRGRSWADDVAAEPPTVLLYCAGLAALVFALGVYPVARWGVSAPIGSNWDAAEFYVPLGRALQLRSQRDLASLPRNPLVQILTTPPVSGRIHAFSYLHAALSSAARVDPLRSYAPIMAFVAALQPLAIYPFARVLHLGRRAALLATTLLALAWLPLWVAYNNFSNHLIALPLLPIALAASVVALRSADRRALWSGALFAGGLATAYYPAMTAYVALFGPAALLVLWQSSARGRTIGRGFLLAALAIALSAPAQYTFFLRNGFLDEILRRNAGFQITEWVGPADALGIAATFNRESIMLDGRIVGVALALAGALALAAIVSRRYGALTAMLAGALAYQGLTFAQHYFYGFYKGATFEIPVLVTLIAAGAEAIVGWLDRSRWRMLGRGAAGLTTALLLVMSAWTIAGVRGSYTAAGPQLWTLDDLEVVTIDAAVPPDASVLLVPPANHPPTFTSLISYVLLGHALEGRISTGYTTLGADSAAPQADAALLPDDESPLSHGYQPDQLVWAGQQMRLYRRSASVRVHRALSGGGNAPTIAPGESLMLRLGDDRIALPDEPTPESSPDQPGSVTLAIGSFGAATVELQPGDRAARYDLADGVSEVTSQPIDSAGELTLRNVGAQPVFLHWAELRDPSVPAGVVPRDDVLIRVAPQTAESPRAAADLTLRTQPLPQGRQQFTGLLVATRATDDPNAPQEVGRWVFFPGGDRPLRLDADLAALSVTASSAAQPVDLFGSSQAAGDGAYQMSLLLANNGTIVYATQLWSWQLAGGAATDIASNSVAFDLVSLPQPVTAREIAAADGSIRLRGFTLADRSARAGGAISPSVVWQSLRRIDGDLRARATIRASDGTALAEQTLPIGADGHGTATWLPGEIAEQTFTLPLPPDAAPGPATLAIEVLGANDQPIALAEQPGAIDLAPITIAP